MFTVGLIGTGKIAGLFDYPQKTKKIDTHAQAIFNNPELELTSVVQPNGSLLSNFSRTWKIQNKYLNIDELLKRNVPDILSICSPSETHFEIALKILQNKSRPKLLLVEKPLCFNSIELQTIAELNKQIDCTVIIHHKRRIDPTHTKLKEIINSFRLGTMLQGQFVYYGGWLNNGVHLIDLIVFLFGSDFILKDILIQDFGNLNDPCLDLNIAFKNFEISIKSFDEKYYQLFEGEFRFSKGRILYNDFGNRIIIEEAKQNKIGELELKPISTLSSLPAPLRILYEKIVNHLKQKDGNNLKSIELSNLEIVMKKLFEAKGN